MATGYEIVVIDFIGYASEASSTDPNSGNITRTITAPTGKKWLGQADVLDAGRTTKKGYATWIKDTVGNKINVYGTLNSTVVSAYPPYNYTWHDTNFWATAIAVDA